MGTGSQRCDWNQLDQGDHVASMEVLEEGGELLMVTTGGYGKRTPLSRVPTQGTCNRGCADD